MLNYVTVVTNKRNTVSSLLCIMIFADYFACDICVYYIRIRRVFLTMDTIDILRLVYSNFYTKSYF